MLASQVCDARAAFHPRAAGGPPFSCLQVSTAGLKLPPPGCTSASRARPASQVGNDGAEGPQCHAASTAQHTRGRAGPGLPAKRALWPGVS